MGNFGAKSNHWKLELHSLQHMVSDLVGLFLYTLGLRLAAMFSLYLPSLSQERGNMTELTTLRGSGVPRSTSRLFVEHCYVFHRARHKRFLHFHSAGPML